MELVGTFQKFHSDRYIVWTFITSIYLNLGLMSEYTQLYINI